MIQYGDGKRQVRDVIVKRNMLAAVQEAGNMLEAGQWAGNWLACILNSLFNNLYY